MKEKISLFIGIRWAGNFVKGPGNTYPNEVINIVVIGISVLIVFHQLVAADGDIVEIIKKSLSCTGFKRQIPFWIQDIFYPQPEGDRSLHIAVFRCFVLCA